MLLCDIHIHIKYYKSIYHDIINIHTILDKYSIESEIQS